MPPFSFLTLPESRFRAFARDLGFSSKWHVSLPVCKRTRQRPRFSGLCFASNAGEKNEPQKPMDGTVRADWML